MKHEPRPGIHIENHLGWSHKWGRTEFPQISKASQTVLARLMESQIWHQPASSVALCGRTHKKDNGLCPPLCLGESCPPAFALIPDSLVSPYMPLVPFKLLPWCWSSEGVNLSKSVCGFFKRNCLELPKFLPPTQSLLVFAARNYGNLSSWHWNPGLGSQV